MSNNNKELRELSVDELATRRRDLKEETLHLRVQQENRNDSFRAAACSVSASGVERGGRLEFAGQSRGGNSSNRKFLKP
jgi:hypothetical protein